MQLPVVRPVSPTFSSIFPPYAKNGYFRTRYGYHITIIQCGLLLEFFITNVLTDIEVNDKQLENTSATMQKPMNHAHNQHMDTSKSCKWNQDDPKCIPIIPVLLITVGHHGPKMTQDVYQ